MSNTTYEDILNDPNFAFMEAFTRAAVIVNRIQPLLNEYVPTPDTEAQYRLTLSEYSIQDLEHLILNSNDNDVVKKPFFFALAIRQLISKKLGMAEQPQTTA